MKTKKETDLTINITGYNNVDFFKSKHKLPHIDGGIFIENKRIRYFEDTYEKLISSNGKEFDVCVSREEKIAIPSDSWFYPRLEHISESDCMPISRYDSHGLIFQFNLKQYYIIYFGRWPYNSAYRLVDDLIGNQQNDPPYYFYTHHWIIGDAYKKTGFFPFSETCFISGNHAEIKNYIPDRIFFNYPDRKQAIERLNYPSKHIFDDIDYISMSDSQLTKFMNERFEKRLAFERIMNQNKFLFTNN